MLYPFRIVLFESYQPKSSGWFENKGKTGCTMAAQPEMHRVPLRLLVKRRRFFVAGRERNRNHFELKQPPLTKRVQWTITAFVDAARQHWDLRSDRAHHTAKTLVLQYSWHCIFRESSFRIFRP